MKIVFRRRLRPWRDSSIRVLQRTLADPEGRELGSATRGPAGGMGGAARDAHRRARGESP